MDFYFLFFLHWKKSTALAIHAALHAGLTVFALVKSILGVQSERERFKVQGSY